MPAYRVDGAHDLSRNAMLLDTNVLVRAFGGEADSEEVQYVLQEMDVQWLVPICSIVEAWGQIVGAKRARLPRGVVMIQWLLTPGKAVVLGQKGEPLHEVLGFINNLGVDVVDAMLLTIATDLTDQCGYTPPMHIASYDGDFSKAQGAAGVRMTAYSFHEAPYNPFEP